MATPARKPVWQRYVCVYCGTGMKRTISQGRPPARIKCTIGSKDRNRTVYHTWIKNGRI